MRRVFTAAAATLAVAACATPEARDEASWAGSIDTLQTGHIVVTNPTNPMWRPADDWQIVEEVRIGSLDGAGADAFGRIASFMVDPEERIWVVEGMTQELRVFSPSGEHIRTVGRAGGGPGEFGEAVRIDLSPDGDVWVMDPPNNRLSIFDTAGVYLGDKYAVGGFLMFPWPGGFDTQGRYYAPGYHGGLVRYNASFEPIDTLGIPEDPVPRDYFRQRTEDGRVVASASIPFTGRLVWRLSPAGTIWALVTDEYRLFELAPDGDTLRTILRPFTPLPVTQADRDQAREDVKWFTDRGGGVDWTAIPGTKPGARSFFLDDEGRPWVVPETDQTERDQVLDAFDLDGRYLGAVHLPFTLAEAPIPFIQNGMLYGTIRDDLDVPYVVRARIVGTKKSAK